MSGIAAAPAAARPRLVTIVALVIAVAAGVLVGFGLNKLPSSAAPGSANASGSAAAAGDALTAVAAGGQIAVDFTSFNYKTLNQDQARTAALLTPTFRRTYLGQSRPLNNVIRRAKSVATSQVVASGLSSYNVGTGTATVIVAVNVTSRNVKTKGAVQYYRFSLQLQRVGDKWLANNVTQE